MLNAGVHEAQSGRSPQIFLILPVLFLLTLLGAWLRFPHLAAQSLWIDEGFSVVAARAIVEYGIPRLADGSTSWNYFPAHYLMALGLFLFQGLETGARFFPALAGTLLIPAVYIFSKQLLRSSWAALICAGLVAFLSYEVDWSRQARSYVILQLLIVWALYSFIRFMEKPRKLTLGLSLALAGVAALTHPAGYIAFLFMAFCIPFDLNRHVFCLNWFRGNAFFLVTVFILIFMSLLILLPDGSNSGPAQVLANLSRSHGMDYSSLYLFFFQSQFGFLLIWAALGAVLGMITFPRDLLPLLLCLFAYLIVISWFSMLFHFRYALPIFLFIPLLIGYGIVAPIQWLLRQASPVRIGLATLLCLTFAATLPSARLTLSPRPYADLGYTAPTADWRGACRWIAQDHAASGGSAETLVTVSTFPMFHDFYLNGLGQKYFLPHSLSGFPGHDRVKDIHTGASTLNEPDVLANMTHGYLFVDKFGLLMLNSRSIQSLLLSTSPTQTVQGPWGNDVYVWRLPLSSVEVSPPFFNGRRNF